jgi:hypothetical protein
MRSLHDEVPAPDMIGIFRPHSDAATVGQPQPSSLGCFTGTFRPSSFQIRSTRERLNSQP